MFALRQIGNRPGNFQGPVVAASRKAELVYCSLQKLSAIGIDMAVLVNFPRLQRCIRLSLSHRHSVTRGFHAYAHLMGRLANALAL